MVDHAGIISVIHGNLAAPERAPVPRSAAVEAGCDDCVCDDGLDAAAKGFTLLARLPATEPGLVSWPPAASAECTLS